MTLLDLLPAATVVPRPVESLLTSLAPNAAGNMATVNNATVVPQLLGAALPTGATVPFAVTDGGGPFALDLTLTGLALDAPAGALAATRAVVGAGSMARVRYTAAGGGVGFGVVGGLRISVGAGNTAQISLSPGLALTANGREILLPSGFGLRLPQHITVAGANLVLTDMEIALPADIPLLGGLAINASLDIGPQRLDVDVPITAAGAGGPDIGGSLHWSLPAGSGLDDFAPTTVDVTLTLPAGSTPLPHTPVSGGPPVNRRVTLRAGISRLPGDPGALSSTVTAEAHGPDGLLSSPTPSTTGDIAAGITAALAPAIAAATGNPTAASLGALFGSASVLANHVAAGGYTLHSVTLDAGTRTSDTGAAAIRVSLEISGAVAIKPLGIPPIKISMAPARPLRVRWRNVRATLTEAGVPTLDFSAARPEVVDPGGWTVDSPGSLLDIIGTRSGSGSTWFEVDLRFALDLGPVKISGATVRATFGPGGDLDVGLRGLDAAIEVPGLLTGSGKVALNTRHEDAGIDLLLAATIIPVNVGALAAFSTGVEHGVRRVQFAFGVDLPGPIPLGPTGLGLYGVLGAFGANAALPPLGDIDPLCELRRWKPWDRLATSAGNMTVGAGLIVGTAVDGGFIVSSRGVLGVTAPDLALRAGLEGKLFASRYTLADVRSVDSSADPPGATFFGGLSATSIAVDIGLTGSYKIPYILDLKLPVAAHFPSDNPVQWWFRAGSDDGVNGFRPQPSRPPGPMRGQVFPDTPFSSGGWAFLMVHGDGITNLLGTGNNFPGFTVAAGAGFSTVFGVRGVLWAEISASLAAAISASPLMLWAKVGVGGEFGIGPFSIGVDATLQLQIGPGTRVGYKLEVCGEIDLWLDTLRGCIRINNLGEQGEIPPPGDGEWPFPAVTLADGLGRSLTTPADLAAGVKRKDRPLESAADTLGAGEWNSTPTVWPDAIPLINFPIAPFCEAGTPQPAATQNIGIVSSGQIAYRWRLLGVRLDRVETNGALTAQTITPTAWQQPHGIPQTSAAASTQRQLALLTGNHGVSAAHLADGGISLRPGHRPSDYIGGLCAWTPDRGRGWSLGEDAEPTGTRAWHAPPEAETFGLPTVLASFARGSGFTVASTRQPNEAYNPGLAHVVGPYQFSPALAVADRELSAALRLASARWTPDSESGGWVTHRIVFDRAVDDGDFYLIVEPSCRSDDQFVERNMRFTISRADTTTEQVAADHIHWDPLVLRIELPYESDNPAIAVTITCPWILSPSILGLHALIAEDAKAADDAETATKSAAGNQAGGDRTVLKPGSRYRLAIEMSWSRLASTDGTVTAADAPQGLTRYWYFRTASAETGGGGGGGGAGGGALNNAAAWKLAAKMPDVTAMLAGVDRFRPDYLGRYLSGYLPADHTQFFFTGDHPSAQFHAGHVKKLAEKFDREIGLLLHRTDRATGPGPDGVLGDYRSDIYQLVRHPHSPLDALVADVAATHGCTPPPTGGWLVWPNSLERNAHYELSVAVPPKGQKAVPGTPELDGITFSTSSYANPRALIEEFGFADPGGVDAAVAHASGDLLVVPTARAAGLVIDDAEYEALIADLGLPPLRPVDAPRSSVLWVADDDSWAIAGVLLESVEPMFRDGGKRMSLGKVNIGAIELPVRRLNGSGTLAAWLAATPITIGAPRQCKLRFTDNNDTHERSVTIQPAPRFARGAVTAGRSR